MLRLSCIFVVALTGCVQNQVGPAPATTPECEVGDDGLCVDTDGGEGSVRPPNGADTDASGSGNRAPQVDGVQILPAGPHYNDATLTCDGAASDPDGNLASSHVTWHNDTRGEQIGSLATLALTSELALPGDAVRCVFRAVDVEGLSDEADAEVVIANRAPQIVGGPSVSPASATPSTTLQCEVTASDPDGTEPDLRFSWHNLSTGEPLGEGSTLSLHWYAALPGHEIACTAVADDGDLDVAEVSTVTLGGGPIASGEALPSEVAGELRYVAPGAFTMGCIPERDTTPFNCHESATPPFEVTISRPMVVMASELTEGMWVGLGLAGGGAAPNSPRAGISWYDALAIANLMSAEEGFPACYDLGSCSGDPGAPSNTNCSALSLTAPSGEVQDCEGWRLPTEAEWEYAARGGEDFRFAGSDVAGDVARYDAATSGPTPVCSFARNAVGLCDMSGNLREWVWAGLGDYASAPPTDPVFPREGNDRMVRGGSYLDHETGVAVGRRSSVFRDTRNSTTGVRFVRTELRFLAE